MNMTMKQWMVAYVTVACVFCAGCGGGGKLAVRSVAEESAQLRGKFTQGVYGLDDRNTLHVLLLEGPAENPVTALHVQMHWRPRAGRTPIAAHATNTSLHYVVFGETGTGVYSGGGFLFLNNKPGGSLFSADVRQATLRLQDSSEGFDDKVGLAQAEGSFTARRDDVQVQRMLRQLHIHLGEKLGYPLLIGRK